MSVGGEERRVGSLTLPDDLIGNTRYILDMTITKLAKVGLNQRLPVSFQQLQSLAMSA